MVDIFASCTDLDDVEDRLEIMERVVEELRSPDLQKPHLEILMTQYTHLEEIVLQTLQMFISTPQAEEVQKRLPGLILKFNKFGCEYQETWLDETWTAYEFAREGYSSSFNKSVKNKPARETAQDIEHLQDLALTLSKLNRETSARFKRRNTIKILKPQTLAMVDSEAENYRVSKKQARAEAAPSDRTAPVKRTCRNCATM